MNDLIQREAELSSTPKFAKVQEAERDRETAQSEASEIQRAEVALSREFEEAKTKLDVFERELGEMLALRARLMIKERPVTDAREKLAEAQRIIREVPLALPYLQRMRGSAVQRSQAAARLLDKFERYCACKTVMLNESYGGNVGFMQALRLMERLAPELGEDAQQDRGAFLEGLKQIRPEEFWAGF